MRFIKPCVESVLAQELDSFDLHIVDSGSTDATLQWIEGLNDSRIHIYTTASRLGIEANWGRIKDIQRNEFMTILGHDDVLDANYLSVMDALIQKHPQASLYQAHFRFINENSEVTGSCKPMDEVQYAPEYMGVNMAGTFDSMATGYMMRSADYDRLGGIPFFPDLIFSDLVLWYQLTAISYKATALAECFSYRNHQSVSRVSIKSIDALEQFVQYIATAIQQDAALRAEVNRHGLRYLHWLCKGLSHRLLRVPYAERNRLNVKTFVEKCRNYARLWQPDIDYNPYKDKSVRLAAIIDSNVVLRKLFYNIRKMYNKPFN